MHPDRKPGLGYMIEPPVRGPRAVSVRLASIFRRGASGRCDGLRITVWD